MRTTARIGPRIRRRNCRGGAIRAAKQILARPANPAGLGFCFSRNGERFRSNEWSGVVSPRNGVNILAAAKEERYFALCQARILPTLEREGGWTRGWMGGGGVELSGPLRPDREKWLRNSVEVLSPGEWGRIHFTAVFVTNVTRGAPTRGRTSREKNKVPLPAASFFSLTLTRSRRRANDDDDDDELHPSQPSARARYLQAATCACAAISTICRYTIGT